MSYYVSIGYATERWTLGVRKQVEMVAANSLSTVPFTVDTIEEAHQLVTLSKSQVWTISMSQDGALWGGQELEASPMVLRTRELDAQDQERYEAIRQRAIQRINAQPKTVTLTWGGIPVTFEREDVDGSRPSYRNEAYVALSVDALRIFPQSFITKSGNIQQAKWRAWGGVKLASLAPHLKKIADVVDKLSTGNYKEEAQP